MNPKKMKQMMKQLGMEMTPIEDVQRIVISTASGEYVFEEAEVVAVTMQGVTTYQVTGNAQFRAAMPAIAENDIQLVMSQSGATEERAKAALIQTRGDIAEAIIRLSTHD